MSVIDISRIHYKLIGVSALSNEENDLLGSIWSERFSKHTAFFTEVNPADSSLMMAKKVYDTINESGYPSANGFQVILAIFVDMTEPMDAAFLKAAGELSAMLGAQLKCSVRLQLLFGFTGMGSLSADGNVPLMQENARKLVDSNPFAKGLYLVGEPAFGGTREFRWKSVCLYLDLLRRDANFQRLQTINHNNGTIGFLRYGEYDEQLLVKLKEEEEILNNNLGNYGHVEFPGALKTRLAAIESKARKAYVVDPNAQPIHPDMIVTGFWNIHKAKRGTNEDFNRGRAQTLAALQESGDSMVRQVMEFYKRQMADPRQFLVDLFTDIHAGIGFVENRAMLRSLMKHQLKHVEDATPPALSYNENGYKDEINSYLTQRLNHGIYKANLWLYEALNRAYANFSEEQIQAERDSMSAQLMIVLNNQSHVPSKKDFCSQAVGQGNNLDAQFSPILGTANDVTLKYLVCRTEDDRAWIGGNCFIGNQQEARFFIHETMGGLHTLDEVPIKAVQALLFDCTEARLNDLLR